MNKLRKKIFWTLWLIFSLFLISILGIFNVQSYNREKMNIERNLFRMNHEDFAQGSKKMEPFLNDMEIPKKEDFKNNPKRFMDATIYTVLLDSDNAILDIISHTEDGVVREELQELAKKIIEEYSKNCTYIGNLYLNTYSYHYELGNHITFIDNRTSQERLISSLQSAILIFIIAEVIIVFLSKILSDWLMRPVNASFSKQKQFIADASHELKTPLTVIMACAESLEKNPKEKKWIKHIHQETEQMNTLITNLLDLAKIENSDVKLSQERTNLSKLVEISILPWESILYEKKIQFHYKIDAGITYTCNSEEIKQLLSILLDNALKHSIEDGEIVVNLTKTSKQLVLQVKNKGKPIPKGEEEKIFERFYRIDKARNRQEGRYGLGLSIAKAIVERHHGSITASSTLEYTTFTVLLKYERTYKI